MTDTCVYRQTLELVVFAYPVSEMHSELVQHKRGHMLLSNRCGTNPNARWMFQAGDQREDVSW